MARFKSPFFIVALGLTPVACSESGKDLTPTTTGAGGTGAGAMGGSAGSTAGMGGSDGGTAAGGGGTAGSGAGMGGTGGGDCAAPCPEGAACESGACVCPNHHPDLCEEANACVQLSSDPANCGQCGMVCEEGAPCVAGACVAPPTVVGTIDGCGQLQMTLFGEMLYLTNDTGDAAGTVLSLPVAGGDPTTIATAQNQPSALAADANGVYWATADGSIMMAPLPTGDPVALVSDLDPPSRGVAVANDLVFYNTGDLFYKIATSGDDAGVGTYVTCTPLDGQAAALFADADRLYWTSDGRQAVETDDQTDGPLDADEPAECVEEGDEGYVELGESQGSLLHDALYAVDGSAYWASGDQIRSAAIADPVNNTIAFTLDFDQVSGLAVTATTAYYAGVDGRVQKLALGTEETVSVALGQNAPRFLATDATNVYWVTADCQVMTSPL